MGSVIFDLPQNPKQKGHTYFGAKRPKNKRRGVDRPEKGKSIPRLMPSPKFEDLSESLDQNQGPFVLIYFHRRDGLQGLWIFLVYVLMRLEIGGLYSVKKSYIVKTCLNLSC